MSLHEEHTVTSERGQHRGKDLTGSRFHHEPPGFIDTELRPNACGEDSSEYWCLCIQKTNHPPVPGTPAAPQNDSPVFFNRIINCVYVSTTAGTLH